jgi:Zn-dependent M28 family amino/carboxypeptidase
MVGLRLAPGGDAKSDGQRDYLQEVEFDYDKLDKRILRATGAEGRTSKGHTQNVIGILQGKTDEVIILSAHYDHLGARPPVEGKDTIYNGADDDASGTAAVMELARSLSRGPKLRRTIYFVLFGAEEFGGVGSDYFDQHPPVPLDKVVANLEFEMLGRPDPKVAKGTLWLTGYEKSDLGKALAKHGAALVADPHPEQNFFQRSDNYQLALKGVVAHTVSSFGLHAQYHRPDDDVAHIDWQHLERSVESMVGPVKWLANSDFQPTWAPGQKPEPK